MKNLLMLVLLGVLCVPAYADSPHDKNIEVKVYLDGEDVLIDVNFTVLASIHQVWEDVRCILPVGRPARLVQKVQPA